MAPATGQGPRQRDQPVRPVLPVTAQPGRAHRLRQCHAGPPAHRAPGRLRLRPRGGRGDHLGRRRRRSLHRPHQGGPGAPPHRPGGRRRAGDRPGGAPAKWHSGPGLPARAQGGRPSAPLCREGGGARGGRRDGAGPRGPQRGRVGREGVHLRADAALGPGAARHRDLHPRFGVDERIPARPAAGGGAPRLRGVCRGAFARQCTAGGRRLAAHLARAAHAPLRGAARPGRGDSRGRW